MSCAVHIFKIFLNCSRDISAAKQKPSMGAKGAFHRGLVPRGVFKSAAMHGLLFNVWLTVANDVCLLQRAEGTDNF